MKLGAIHDSRKITGLVIVLAALCFVTVLAVVAIGLWGVDWQVFASAYTAVTTLGGAHQGAQAMQDRAQAYSPNYPVPPADPPPVRVP